MSAGAPWSVKGIDPKAREVAKDLARRSGMTLGEWLNRVILEDDPAEEVTAESQVSDRTHRASQDLPRLAVVQTSPDMARIAVALDRVTDRIEASETRTGLAINGIEHSVRQALARIEIEEREQPAVAGRIEGPVADAPDQQTCFSDHQRRLEAEAIGPRSAEALRALEGRIAEVEPEVEPEVSADSVLQRLGERLAMAEARTAAALENFKSSLGSLDQRLGVVERGGGDQVDQKFERLGEVLTQRVEAVRAEVVQKLEASVGPGFETRMAAMAHTVRQAELRSTQAVEQIGRQVLSMAEAVGRKLSDVDQRGAAAIDQVGSEVARIAGAVELRLARSEHIQAEAFERLGAELGRVTEALGERQSASGRHSSPTLEGVVSDMSRFRAAMDAALPMDLEPDLEPASPFAAGFEAPAEPEPARQTDPEPEARLAISEAFEPQPAYATPTEFEPEPELAVESAAGLQPDVQTAALLEEAHQRLGPPPEPEPEADAPVAAFEDGGPYGEELFSRAEAETDTEDFTAAPEAIQTEPDAPPEIIDAPWRRLDFEAPEGDIPEIFAPINESEDEDLFAPAKPQLSTREVIDRARAAARASGVKPVEMQAKISGRAASGQLFQGFAAKPAPRRQNSALQTALMVAGGAAFLSVGAAGLALMQDTVAEPRTAELSPFGSNPRAAIALSPGGLAPSGSVNRPAAAPVYAQVRADVESGTPGAVTQLKTLAESGDIQAQLYLAELYDLGEAGLPLDPAEARRLIGLAAESGDAHAMHNLGVFYFRGEGGAQDLASAAQWFRKAATVGVVESQYNLGLLYQSGSGVQLDLAQARYWFEQAAARGDSEARRALAQMGSQPEVVRPKRASAPAVARKSAPVTGTSQNVRQTQLILARLGYYDGPADGVSSASYRAALAEYQSDQTDRSAGPRPYAAQR